MMVKPTETQTCGSTWILAHQLWNMPGTILGPLNVRNSFVFLSVCGTPDSATRICRCCLSWLFEVHLSRMPGSVLMWWWIKSGPASTA